MKKSKIKLSLNLIIILVIITEIIVIELSLSKYETTKAGENITSIAKWEVTLDTTDNENDNLELVCGNTTQNYILKVTSLSDVSVSYSVFISDIPNDVKVSLDGGQVVTPLNNEITFENVGTFLVNDENSTRNHTLTFSADLNTNSFDDDINIDLTFTQIN